MCEPSPTGTPIVLIVSDQTLAELASMRQQFPQFRIWQEDTGRREPRFVARRRHPGINPHTVITADPAELRIALTAPTPEHPSDSPAQPERDQITLTSPRGRHLCNSREHREAARLADVIVTFGTLANPGSTAFSPDALWPECWGVAYPMCSECWEVTHTVAAARHPALAVRDLTAQTP